jgi:hypothetical protein
MMQLTAKDVESLMLTSYNVTKTLHWQIDSLRLITRAYRAVFVTAANRHTYGASVVEKQLKYGQYGP